jgi:acetyl esterase/lipase
MRRLRIGLTALALIGLGHAASVSAQEGTHCPPRAIVLLIHGGGFVAGTPHLRPLADRLRAEGLCARSVGYRLDGDPVHAIHDVRAQVVREQRRGRRVYLYGLSAGATIAASLAARGKVAGAVAVAPVTDFGRYHGNPIARARQATRLLRRVHHPAPLLVVHGRDDTVVPFETSVAFVARDPQARLLAVPAGAPMPDAVRRFTVWIGGHWLAIAPPAALDQWLRALVCERASDRRRAHVLMSQLARSAGWQLW